MSTEEAAVLGDETEHQEAPAGPEMRYGCPVSSSMDQQVIHVAKDAWFDTAVDLFADGWNMCVDLTAVDYLAFGGSRVLPEGIAAERFEIVASFISHTRRERLRARTQVAADDTNIGSLYQLFPGTDYMEREVFDLFGITFDGHPDMSRILMPEGWQGHPLRKDYAVGAIPVQFKAPRN